MRYSLISILVYTALAAPNTGGTNQESQALATIKHTDGISVAGNTKASNASSNIGKRGYITETCDNDEEEKALKAMEKCKTFARAAIDAIEDNRELRRKYFKTDSSKHIESIQETFRKIERGCDSSIDNIPFRCEARGANCNGCNAYTIPKENRVYLCPEFFQYSSTAGGRSIVHELSHLNSSKWTLRTVGNSEINKSAILIIRGTQDHDYGDASAQALKKAKSMMNADNFAWFAYYAEHPDGDGGYWSD
ncbi:hypothetical protein M0657_007698 [Pyricularia oryzae]|nr:hypothetical protein M0657_007698 [Pyricularia oryzae]